MKTLILEIKKGGLGDHLFYSHLPRIAKESGIYNKVLLSEHSLFRHPDYRKLVWESNPYLDGYTQNKGIYFLPDQFPKNQNLLDSIMLAYGIDDGKRFHEPEIYFIPELKPELKDASVYDPNFISYTGDIASGRLIQKWFDNSGITINYQMKQLGKRILKIQGLAELEATSLFDFCSIIYSVKDIYCLTTGTATLAAALGKPVTVFYGTGHLAKYRHSKLHKYICLGTDYGIKEIFYKRITLILRKFVPLGTP